MNDEIKNETVSTVVVETPVVTKKKKTKNAAQVETEPVAALPVFLTAEQKRLADHREKVGRLRKENARLVTGRFLFNECPNGRLKFVFREFPGDPLAHYDLIHGQTYTIPLGVARHLNERCAYSEFHHNLDAGKAVDAAAMYVVTKINRCNFIPLDFTIDSGYVKQNISQATYTNPVNMTNLLGS